MKFAISSLGVVVIILVVGQILASKHDDFKRVRIPCMKQNNITYDEFDALVKDINVEGLDMKFKCFGQCVVNEMGYLDEVGKVNMKILEEDDEVPEDVVAKVKECTAEHDMIDESCEYIFQVINCVMEAVN